MYSNNSIFKNPGVNFKELFSSFNPDEVLYVSIDIAKYNHSAMIVNFSGKVIVPKFDFPYNNHGIDFFKNKLLVAQQQTQARKLLLGLESTGHYHENLVASLLASGYDIVESR